MTVTVMDLAAWVGSLPLLCDATGHPHARSEAAALAIAQVAIEAAPASAFEFAATLDVIAAHESGYQVGARGDRGRSCGAYQTPCVVTPKDFLGQTRVAARIFAQASVACPAHPLWSYASGLCKKSRAAEDMAQAIGEHLAAASAPERGEVSAVMP